VKPFAGRLNVIWQVAVADYRERARRYSFWVAMVACAWLSYMQILDKVQVSLGENYGYFNSAWSTGALVVLANTVLTLFGFFVVKNTLERDAETRVGVLLAAAPMSSVEYLMGKALSNFLTLSSFAAVFLLAAPVLQKHRGPEYPIQPLIILGQFLPMALPTLAFVAALAVLWECVPLLKRGFGNIAYIIAWMFTLTVVGIRQVHSLDLLGLVAFMESGHAAARAQGIAGVRDFELNIGHTASEHTGRFLWNGIRWSLATVLERAEWLVLAVVVAAAGVFFFKRFDPDYSGALARSAWQGFMGRFRRTPAGAQPESKWASAALPRSLVDGYSQLAGYTQQFQFVSMVRAELRLMLRSVPLPVFGVMALINFIALVAPKQEHVNVLPLVWFAPVLLWSQMGTRERRENTAAMLFSAPHSFLRQLPALWTAGALVTLLSAIGMVGRAWMQHDSHMLDTCIAGAIFIPSLALACGVWSNTPRLFEVLYVTWWYVAVNGAPFADFVGMTPQSSPLTYILLGAVLFAPAMMRRWWDVERGPAQRVLAFRQRA
jgi:hypothetical protein